MTTRAASSIAKRRLAGRSRLAGIPSRHLAASPHRRRGAHEAKAVTSRRTIVVGALSREPRSPETPVETRILAIALGAAQPGTYASKAIAARRPVGLMPIALATRSAGRWVPRSASARSLAWCLAASPAHRQSSGVGPMRSASHSSERAYSSSEAGGPISASRAIALPSLGS